MGSRYDPTVWEDFPNTSSPINASRLNHIEEAMAEVFDNVNALSESVDACFTSVSNGKRMVASAVTDKGSPIGATATFSEIVEAIYKIPTDSKNTIRFLVNAICFIPDEIIYPE